MKNIVTIQSKYDLFGNEENNKIDPLQTEIKADENGQISLFN